MLSRKLSPRRRDPFLFEVSELRRRKLAPLARPKPLGIETRKRDSRKPQYGVPDGIAHAMDLTVFSLKKRNFNPSC